MKFKKALQNLVRVVINEANENPGFAHEIEMALGIQPKPEDAKVKRPSHRRTPGVLDPIELARQGEGVLMLRLKDLSLEQLRDIVADYGMDPGKLVMKWKTSDRVIDKIIEYSLARAKKGEAFLR